MIIPKNVLVTGANGYLGGHVVKELRKAGHRLNLMNSHGEMLSILEFEPKLVEVVVHLGWYAVVGMGHKEIQQECLDRTKSLVQIMYKYQPQFIFASSAAVYGDSGDKICSEVESKLSPNCYYSHAKALAEKDIHAFIKRHMLFRFGSLMGLGIGRTKRELVVNAFSIDGWTKKKVEVWNGECWKPFIHVKDAASVIRFAIEKRWVGVANAAFTSMRAIEIAQKVSNLTGASIEEVRMDGVVRKSCMLNCTKLRRFTPRSHIFMTLPETIREMSDYIPSDADKNISWGQRRV